MRNVRLIAFDLDGTLLDSDKRLSEENAAALARAAERGVEIVPATGRFYRLRLRDSLAAGGGRYGKAGRAARDL